MCIVVPLGDFTEKRHILHLECAVLCRISNKGIFVNYQYIPSVVSL